MARNRFEFAARLSLLLLVVIGLLWPLSYLDWLARSWRGRFVVMASYGDDRNLVDSYAVGPEGLLGMLRELRFDATTHWVHAGVEFHYGTIRIDELGGGPKSKYWLILVPHWMVMCLCAVLPIGWIMSVTLRRRPSGRCQHCGYDLRASAGRCPECGTPCPTG